MDIPTIIVVLGSALLLAAIFGGGITFKEVNIPTISNKLRIILVPIGTAFIVLGVILWINPAAVFNATPKTSATPAEVVPSQSAVVVAPPTVDFAPADATQTAIPAKTTAACDEFDTHAGGWSVFGDRENGEVGYAGGKFRIAYYSPGQGFNSSWSRDEYTDFTVETLFSVPADATGAGGGLTLRAKDKQWYLLWFYPASKTYVFSKDLGGRSENLVPLTRVDSLTPKSEAGRLYLQVKVVAVGNQFEIFAAAPGENYQHLATLSDASLSSGYLGPTAPHPTEITTSPAETLFEWICISKP